MTVVTTAAPVLETTAAPTTTTPPETTVAVTEAEPNPFPDIEDLTFEDLSGMAFILFSGVGDWQTMLEVFPDGSFRGHFIDSNVAETYYCAFSGTFAGLERVGPYMYTMRLEILVSEGVPEDYIPREDIASIPVVESNPSGLVKADEMLVFLPGMDKSELPEDYLFLFGNPYDTASFIKLYGIYNVTEQVIFGSLEEEYANYTN